MNNREVDMILWLNRNSAAFKVNLRDIYQISMLHANNNAAKTVLQEKEGTLGLIRAYCTVSLEFITNKELKITLNSIKECSEAIIKNLNTEEIGVPLQALHNSLRDKRIMEESFFQELNLEIKAISLKVLGK